MRPSFPSLLLVEKALKIAAAHDELSIPADQRIR
jgi:hypothetical protein